MGENKFAINTIKLFDSKFESECSNSNLTDQIDRHKSSAL